MSVRFENKAAESYRSGDLLGLQTPSGTEWLNYITPGSVYDTISKDPKTEDLLAANGAFIYRKPDGAEDNKLTSYRTVVNDNVVDSFWPIDYSNGQVLLYMNIPIPTSGAPNPQFGNWIVHNNVEFTTGSQWFYLEAPFIKMNVYNKAIDLLADMKQVFENPLHWGDIWKGIKTVAGDTVNGVLNYGPKLMSFGQQLFPDLFKGMG
jgi:hypothetical protein